MRRKLWFAACLLGLVLTGFLLSNVTTSWTELRQTEESQPTLELPPDELLRPVDTQLREWTGGVRGSAGSDGVEGPVGGGAWPDTPPDASPEQRMLDKRHILTEQERQAALEAWAREQEAKQADWLREKERLRYDFWKSVLTTAIPAVVTVVGLIIGVKAKS
jgi:hypothetical protein